VTDAWTPCPDLTKAGLPCRNRTKAEWDGRCHMHWAKATGRKMPQEYRRRVKAGSLTDLLGAFGLGKADIIRLREAVPEVDAIMSRDTALMDALDLTAKALALRLIAKPDRNIADALAVLAKVIQANQAPAAPIAGQDGGFRDLFAEGGD
jgi:hypothetical protein